jgi:hypothetical protein
MIDYTYEDYYRGKITNGTKVRLKKEITEVMLGDLGIDPQMKTYADRVVTISECNSRFFKIADDPYGWFWSYRTIASIVSFLCKIDDIT